MSASRTALNEILPDDTRQAWERAVVAYACREIGASYDRLLALVEPAAPCPAPIRERIDRVLRGLGWSRAAALAHAAAIAEEDEPGPEEQFGIAAVLIALEAEAPAARAWLAALPAEVTTTLAIMGWRVRTDDTGDGGSAARPPGR